MKRPLQATISQFSYVSLIDKHCFNSVELNIIFYTNSKLQTKLINKYLHDELIRIAKIHAKRLSLALKLLAPLIPFTSEKIEFFRDQDFATTEFMICRFTKLAGKLGKLEQFYTFSTKNIWKETRELRNHLAHEYPEQPELVAVYLNQTYAYSLELIKILSTLLKLIEKNTNT